MPYQLSTQTFAEGPSINIIGCGGTGAFVAEGICRLFTGRQAAILLTDHDVVEPHNLLRQLFYQQDIGRYKSQALAERLSRAYQRTIGYSTNPLVAQRSYSPRYRTYHKANLVIGCVDNAEARRTMNNNITDHNPTWTIDAGNGYTWGQVLIGNTKNTEQLQGSFYGDVCTRLPSPVLQRPDLLTTLPHTPPDVDCAAALDLTDQDPTINQMMAAWILHIIRRMAVNSCPFMTIDLDLDLGTAVPTYATPENVARSVRIPVEALIYDLAQPPAPETTPA